ncbi:MAG: META domain-containing protein [Armatimonadota bacterium]|nr:MAG: META domain-containing protein [Armatimonadota bacterium]
MTLQELRLPATFNGMLTMLDDDVREVTLDLRADERFLWRETPVAKDGSTGASEYDRGRWYLAYGGRQLVLIGESEGPRKFEPEGPDRLRALEGGGIAGVGQYIARTEEAVPFADSYGMQGMFSYMADAALFTDCLMGKRFPVAMASDYLALEQAYLDVDREPGEAVLATIEGHLAQRPRMEGAGTEENIVVDHFVAISPGGSCEPRAALAEPENTYWKLVEVSGAAVEAPDEGREAHLILRPAEKRVSGNTGCNQINGGYTLEGERLKFGPLATTLRACPDEPDIESAFLGALETVTRYELYGERLELYSGSDLVARLEARYMK